MLKVREYRPEGFGGWLIVTFWVALLVLLGVVAFDAIVHGTLVRPEAFVVAGVTGVAIAVILGWSVERERARRMRERALDEAEGDVEFGVGGAFYDGNETVQRTKHRSILLLALLIGAVMPALAMFFATDMNDFLLLEGGLAVKDGLESRLVSRVVQAIYTGVLSLFPALLYFQFDRQRVGTIRGRWVRAIFRMDTDNAHAGRHRGHLRRRAGRGVELLHRLRPLLGGRHSPILVATILITLGWTLLVSAPTPSISPAPPRSRPARIAEDAADRAATPPPAPTTWTSDTCRGRPRPRPQEAAEARRRRPGLAGLSTGSTGPPPADDRRDHRAPTKVDRRHGRCGGRGGRRPATAAEARPTILPAARAPAELATMAFLGAYFFAMYLVLRSYFRGDLRPKVYNQITTRLVTVVILGYLLTALYTGASEKARAHDGRLLRRRDPAHRPAPRRARRHVVPARRHGLADARVRWRRGLDKAVGSPRALTQVDGIDIYEAALESEGITDVTSLAKTDLITMMINTRLPVERLVDWADQAILILLLDEGEDDELDGRIIGLRKVSVRTATDLTTGGRAARDAYSRRGHPRPGRPGHGAARLARRRHRQRALRSAASGGGAAPTSGPTTSAGRSGSTWASRRPSPCRSPCRTTSASPPPREVPRRRG